MYIAKYIVYLALRMFQNKNMILRNIYFRVIYLKYL